MLAKTFSFMIILSFVCAILTGNVENMSAEFSVSISDAVTLCMTLAGMMCFWSGFMNVLKDAGILKYLSKLLKPIMKLVYGKNIDSESIDNLSASFSANFLGLGNAALPLGVRAINSLEKGNNTGIATDSSIMFAVLNTVPFQLIPATLIALRSKYNSTNPFDVVPAIWLCSLLINLFAIIVCKLFGRIWRGRE